MCNDSGLGSEPAKKLKLKRVISVSQAEPNKIASNLFEQPEWEENTGSTNA